MPKDTKGTEKRQKEGFYPVTKRVKISPRIIFFS